MTPSVTPVADNPAVTNPRRVLNMAQRDALLSIDFFRHHRPRGTTWAIGDKRFNVRTINALARLDLVRVGHQSLRLTTAGQIAAAKLKGASDGTA
ncbi:hypothetical protein B5P46_11700 [Rhizobium leguminosarum]|uniref:Uncharacterized protein n=1 Tax=Rhizobium leguminosarum TaxID=384 RepID=A0A4Q1UBG1_RHILE|nr:hypothetical protein [Rhizobium leguminosarum]RXT29339.1 hypothetical protein B5P46_11700 [Rhizobium leguminosarum]